MVRIVHIVPSFFPATYWGGPIFSTKTICDQVSARADFALSVLTTDAAGPLLSQRIKGAEANFAYPVLFTRRIFGHSISLGLLWRLPRAIASADVVHLTATFSFPTLPVFFLARILRKPLVWSPRGAVQATEEWSATPRRLRKRLFLGLARIIAPTGMTVHVTAESERIATHRYFPTADFAVIANGVELPRLIERADRPADSPLRLMFLSRLHPKKGLDRLIEAVRQLPANISLDIYGTGDPSYIAHIREIASDLSGRVTIHGEVQGSRKEEAFRNADIFVLPSFSENFGIVVAEALAHGLPVITTTRTPWAELERRGCGLLIDPERDDLAGAIMQLVRAKRPAMGAAGRYWMEESFSSEAVGKAFEVLYRRKASSYE